MVIMEFKNKNEEYTYNAMQSGKYSIASLDLLNCVDKIKLSDNTKSHIEYTNELLFEYLRDIYALKEETPGLKEFLVALKAADVIDNQSLEQENSFLLGLYMQTIEETAQQKLEQYFKNNVKINKELLKDLAKTLLTGTSTKPEGIIRESNEKFVGRMVNGEPIISYFPIDYHDIDEGLTRVSEIYNERLAGETYDNLFMQPFLIHGLFGALQMFGDGNTRMGRLHQHMLLWQLINERTEYNFDSPPLFFSRAYYPFRGDYRALIANLVKNGDSEAWNEWFLFNLKRLEDQIFQNNEHVLELKRNL